MAGTDLLTSSEANAFLRGLDGEDSDRVLLLVGAVSARLDSFCGPLVVREVVETYWPSAARIFLSPSAIEVTSVVSEAFDGTETTFETTDYHLVGGRLNLVYGVPYVGAAVTVTYTAGRYANTAAVDPVVKQAAGLFVQHLWRPAEGGGSETYGVLSSGISSIGIPNVVADLLAGLRRTPGIA